MSSRDRDIWFSNTYLDLWMQRKLSANEWSPRCCHWFPASRDIPAFYWPAIFHGDGANWIGRHGDLGARGKWSGAGLIWGESPELRGCNTLTECAVHPSQVQNTQTHTDAHTHSLSPLRLQKPRIQLLTPCEPSSRPWGSDRAAI